MSLSDFGYDILRVLDEAGDYISPQEIAQRLSEEQGESVLSGRVRPYLEHALGEYVERRSPNSWNIASPHHGRFASNKRQASEEETESSSERVADQGKNLDELSMAIVRELADASSPLSSERITEAVKGSDAVSSNRSDFITTQVNRRLYSELSSVVEKDDDHRWRLIDRTYANSDESDEATDEKIADRTHGVQDSPTRQSKTAERKNDGEKDKQRENQRKSSRVDNWRAGDGNQDDTGDDADAAREESRDNETSLSEFEQDVLSTLDELDGHAFTEEIVEKLHQKYDRDAETGRIQFYLENALDEFVVRHSSKGWNIAPSYRGEFSSREESASDEDPDELEETASENDHESEGKLSELVVYELSKVHGPLKARQIAEKISVSSDTFSSSRINDLKTEVNRRLYGELSSRVEKDDEHRWQLIKQGYDEVGEPGEDSPEGSDVTDTEVPEREEEGKEKEDPQSEKETKSPGEESYWAIYEKENRASKDLTSGTPSGVAGEIEAKLETAKQIAFLLDLARKPVSVSTLAAVISARGRETSEETIRHSLESTLARFVCREKEGYRLSRNPGGQVPETDKESSDAASSDEPDELEDNGEPVDAVTRATVSGSRYKYIFEQAEFENTALLFSQQIRGGTVRIELNSAHPAFGGLRHVLDGLEESSKESTQGQLREAIRLLIIAWTEVEEDLGGRQSDLAEEMRIDWGRALRRLLRERTQA